MDVLGQLDGTWVFQKGLKLAGYGDNLPDPDIGARAGAVQRGWQGRVVVVASGSEARAVRAQSRLLQTRRVRSPGAAAGLPSSKC